ncbi:MAG TPA: substrate-binding domain-containing protein, partial [Usitatibacter sp.]|nr:substrate-binding domain-containing protein [Usitatibacter sp.]
MKRLAFLAAALACLAATAHAAEITVLSGGAVKSAFTEAAKAWERKTGNAVKATFAPAGDLRRKIAAGESADVLIVPRENLAEFEKAGALAPGVPRDLAGVAMGAAVRKGAPVPDISTPEALKRTLLQAKSLTYMDPARGTSGRHFDQSVLPALGIRDEVRAKTVFGEGGFIAEKVARGEVEIAFHQITEILPVPGVTVVGPLPGELQKVTVYSGAVMKGAAHRAEARSLLDFLASPEGRKAFLDRGFT